MKHASNKETIAYDAICAWLKFINKKYNANLRIAETQAGKYRIASFYHNSFKELPCFITGHSKYSFRTFNGLLNAMLRYKNKIVFYTSNIDKSYYNTNRMQIDSIAKCGQCAEEILMNLQLQDVE